MLRPSGGHRQIGYDSDIHSAGGAVGVWPVDDETAIAWCQLCRPDSVFTNRPVEVGKALRA